MRILNSGSITTTVSVMALKSAWSLVLCSLTFFVMATSSWFFFTSRSFWFSRSIVRSVNTFFKVFVLLDQLLLQLLAHTDVFVYRFNAALAVHIDKNIGGEHGNRIAVPVEKAQLKTVQLPILEELLIDHRPYFRGFIEPVPHEVELYRAVGGIVEELVKSRVRLYDIGVQPGNQEGHRRLLKEFLVPSLPFLRVDLTRFTRILSQLDLQPLHALRDQTRHLL